MILENALFSQEIPAKGAGKGHVRFHLKSAKPEDIALVGFCANVAASLLFERLQAQGTNIIMNLSKDALIDVLARTENDGLNLLWNPKPADPAQINDTQERIRNKTFLIGKVQVSEKKEITEEPLKNEPSPQLPDHPADEDHEDYLVKQLYRVP